MFMCNVRTLLNTCQTVMCMEDHEKEEGHGQAGAARCICTRTYDEIVHAWSNAKMHTQSILHVPMYLECHGRVYDIVCHDRGPPQLTLVDALEVCNN